MWGTTCHRDKACRKGRAPGGGRWEGCAGCFCRQQTHPTLRVALEGSPCERPTLVASREVLVQLFLGVQLLLPDEDLPVRQAELAEEKIVLLPKMSLEERQRTAGRAIQRIGIIFSQVTGCCLRRSGRERAAHLNVGLLSSPFSAVQVGQCSDVRRDSCCARPSSSTHASRRSLYTMCSPAARLLSSMLQE